ncbi:Mitochondrial import receptor subunit tom20 [Hypsizygus marmoreus]|uniref:Mitochondrial import receptor subunit tom20 n=1 Tax=Hypsizygus marmoreus TaxID=39966 RepID=A0A369JDA9_HYPMA|nr:Mitochondrial import receptor subunit tom20 [Hypsizygus marmoreus]
MDSRTSSILTIAGITVLGGVLAYAAYFDYKRRNDVDFRKKLRKDKKRVNKSLAQSRESLAASSSKDVTPASLREALEQVKNEEGPQSPEEKEAYFMSQVSMGEQLAIKGPDFYLASAISFYRALRVYPSPVELIVIYQKTVPEPIFKMVMDMTNLDVKNRVEGYYDAFPPESMNVAVETREGRKVLVLTKDVASGEVIYKEHPVVTALDPDIQIAGTHCAHCFRVIQSPMSIQLPSESNPLSSTFCSKACLISNKSQSHSLLFTTESPLPPEITPAAPPPEAVEARRRAQANFVAYLKKEGRAAPQLVARFIARQVALETSKMVEGGKKKASEKDDFTDAEGGEYLLADHIERLRYLEVKPSPEELPLLVNILQTALPGLEQFVTDERHATLLGKMAYNAFGVCFGGGRDNKPESEGRPEDVEKSRTPYGTSRQIGSALYTLSSYLSHSCAPSARPSFSSGTAEISVIANRDLKKGDELSIAYVDVTQHPDESVVECRQRRRKELARGWRFACGCSRCEEEAKAMSTEEKVANAGEAEQKDESKVEASLSRYEDAEESGNVE